MFFCFNIELDVFLSVKVNVENNVEVNVNSYIVKNWSND